MLIKKMARMLVYETLAETELIKKIKTLSTYLFGKNLFDYDHPFQSLLLIRSKLKQLGYPKDTSLIQSYDEGKLNLKKNPFYDDGCKYLIEENHINGVILYKSKKTIIFENQEFYKSDNFINTRYIYINSYDHYFTYYIIKFIKLTLSKTNSKSRINCNHNDMGFIIIEYEANKKGWLSLKNLKHYFFENTFNWY